MDGCIIANSSIGSHHGVTPCPLHSDQRPIVQKLGFLGATLLLAMTLPACGPQAAPVEIEDLPGTPLDTAKELIPEDDALTVIDASTAFGEEPTYDADPGLEGRWMVIAACADGSSTADADRIELAVAPADAWEAEDPSAEDIAGYSEYVDCTDS